MLRKICDSLLFIEKVNGYAPEKVAFRQLVLQMNGYAPEKFRFLGDFVHFYVLLWTKGYQKEPISALLTADCSPGMLNGYAPEYVDTKNQFSSIFIIEQRGTDNNYQNHISKLFSLTMYVDTSRIFAKENPNIPSESMYHTFLLDENNNVIFVGNPLFNEEVHKVFFRIVNEKLGKSK